MHIRHLPVPRTGLALIWGSRRLSMLFTGRAASARTHRDHIELALHKFDDEYCRRWWESWGHTESLRSENARQVRFANHIPSRGRPWLMTKQNSASTVRLGG